MVDKVNDSWKREAGPGCLPGVEQQYVRQVPVGQRPSKGKEVAATLGLCGVGLLLLGVVVLMVAMVVVEATTDHEYHTHDMDTSSWSGMDPPEQVDIRFDLNLSGYEQGVTLYREFKDGKR